MTVAIVGGGFAGVAAAYYLSRHFSVTLFDPKGIGGGASRASSGLLHPYPGEKGRRSWHADEALAATRELLAVAEAALGAPVANYNGILKIGSCLNPGPDVTPIDSTTFLIESGITVFPELYLDGLWKACQARGCSVVHEAITSLEALKTYDRVVLAVGAAVQHFPECRHLKLGFVKGQALTTRLQKPLERSISAKHYTALTADPTLCHRGATYERAFDDDRPSLETAQQLLNISSGIIECKAGVRVTNPAHYFPIVEQITPRAWVITALGSRGLLYHAYLAQRLTIF